MTKYIILIANRYDSYDRYWVRCESLERANKLAYEYTKDNKYTSEIYELGKEL